MLFKNSKSIYTKALKETKDLNLKQYCMHCYVALSYIFFQLIHVKTSIQYINRKLLRKLANYKVC